ncbi:MAG: DEAD/DEAH box helicase [Niveispirillum sp.]|nr:DEAD/DEAH box helicase [Niveispirillum sp.]
MREKDLIELAAVGIEQLDDMYVQRGAAYFRNGRVSGVELEPELDTIYGQVQGSEPDPYDVCITFSRNRFGYRLESDCTCPVGHDCKHVAAVLYAVRDQQGNKAAAGQPSLSRKPAIPPTDQRNLDAWISSLIGLRDGPKQPTSEHVRYLLAPAKDGQQPPTLTPHLSRMTQKGVPGKGRTLAFFALQSPTMAGATEEDRRLAHMFGSVLGLHNNLPDDDGMLAELLPRFLATERLHFLSFDTPALRLGPARAACIDWALDAHGRQVPVTRPKGGGEALGPAAAGLWYLDTDQGLLGPLELPAARPLMLQLLRAPPLDPMAATKVARQLPALLPQSALAGGAVTLPQSTATVAGDDSPPLIRLVLATHQPMVQASRWQPVMEPTDRAYLTFDYGGTIVTDQSGPDEFRQVHGAKVTIRQRRRDVERLARQRLADANLLPAYALSGSFGGKKAPPVPPGTAFTLHGPPEAAWLTFLDRVVPGLRADGWQVEISPDFRWHLTRIEEWEGAVEAAGGGWFDLDLGIRIDGRRVPLLPLLLAVLKRLGKNGDPQALLAADPDAMLYAPLPGGGHVALPVARVAPLTKVLLDLFEGAGVLDGAGRVRIDLGRAALLDGMRGMPDLLRPGQRDKLRRLLEPAAEVAEPAGLSTTLRPYQRQGLGWLLALAEAGAGGILADDMGLGKTLQVIAFILALKQQGRLMRPALVVAPTSVAPNWPREAARHAPGLTVHLHHGPDRADGWAAAQKADIVVTSYPLLHRDHDLLKQKPWSVLILDEAQMVKNQAGKLATLVRDLPAEHRLCVTGTPLENHLGELWTQMDFAMPGLLSDSRSFNRLFRSPIEKRGDGERQQLLTGRLRPFILRRNKAEVAADLPPKTEIVERITLPDDQRDLYETLRLTMDAKVRKAIADMGLGRSHILILEALLRLRQACCDPALLPATAVTKAVSSAKRAHLMQMLPELVQEGRRILLFSQFTSMLDLIRADLDSLGLRHVSLTGDTKDRTTPVDRFQAGEADVFLISMKAGGTGLTLTAADTVIHYDPWWNPAVEDQATDRAHRIGQDKPVFVYRLVADGTVEDRMLDLQARKRQLAEALHDGGGDSPGALTEDDIERLFAPITELAKA